MRLRTFAALLTIAVILGANFHLNALQSTSPQPKDAQAAPAPAGSSQSEDPTKKLGAFVGKWETEGAFTSGQKNFYHSGMSLVAARLLSGL